MAHWLQPWSLGCSEYKQNILFAKQSPFLPLLLPNLTVTVVRALVLQMILAVAHAQPQCRGLEDMAAVTLKSPEVVAPTQSL